MGRRQIRRTRQSLAAVLAFALLCALPGTTYADEAAAQASSLRARHAALQEQLGNSQFQRPLHLDSSETRDRVAGDVHAVVNFPFDAAGAALSIPGDWCDILMLHINTKTCRVSDAGAETVLSLWVGAKHEQPIEEATRVDFAYRVLTRSKNYLRVSLNAADGPIGTRDYRIVLEAIPLGNGRTFIHFAYSYGYGVAGRFAMQTYLATVGRNKVGFTVAGVQPDGSARHIGGLRGVVERNAMRYYLAIEAFLGSLVVAPPMRFEKRIRDWYAASERYPLQLHELEQADYLEMKRRENQRQQAGPA